MDRIVKEAISRLKTAGIPAVEAFPGGIMPKITCPVAAVNLETVTATDGGFGRQLGSAKGRQVQAVVLVRLFTPHGKGSAAAGSALMEWGAVQKVELGEPVFDDIADCFTAVLRAHISGLLADTRPGEDTSAFTDFTLEGDLQ